MHSIQQASLPSAHDSYWLSDADAVLLLIENNFLRLIEEKKAAEMLRPMLRTPRTP